MCGAGGIFELFKSLLLSEEIWCSLLWLLDDLRIDDEACGVDITPLWFMKGRSRRALVSFGFCSLDELWCALRGVSSLAPKLTLEFSALLERFL